jgi:hypothetical protein
MTWILSHLPAIPLLFVGAAGCLPQAAFAHEPGEMIVGRTGAGQLVVTLEFDQPVELPRSIFPSAPGFATSLMGFESRQDNQPTEDRFTLAVGAQVHATLVSIDPGAVVYIGPPWLPGESIDLGEVPFDYHPIFSINAAGAVHGDLFTVCLQLHDDSGLYTDSDVVTIVMTPISECGTADFNGDGDIGTDSDIAAFFACLSGSCCSSCGSADFNADGDLGADTDIESFFRVLGGGPC